MLSANGNVSTNGVNLKKVAQPLGATIILFGLVILVFGTHIHRTTYRWTHLTRQSLSSPYRSHSVFYHTVCTPPRILSCGAEFHHNNCFCPRVAGWHRLRHHYRSDATLMYTRVNFMHFKRSREANAGWWDCGKTGTRLCRSWCCSLRVDGSIVSSLTVSTRDSCSVP